MTRIDRLSVLITAALMLVHFSAAAYGVRVVRDVLTRAAAPLAMVAAH
jgi:hypothetical protein